MRAPAVFAMIRVILRHRLTKEADKPPRQWKVLGGATGMHDNDAGPACIAVLVYRVTLPASVDHPEGEMSGDVRDPAGVVVLSA